MNNTMPMSDILMLREMPGICIEPDTWESDTGSLTAEDTGSQYTTLQIYKQKNGILFHLR